MKETYKENQEITEKDRLTTEEQEIFDAISSDVREAAKKGILLKCIDGDVCGFKVDKIVDQPTEGLLYDLDMLPEELSALYKKRPLFYADQMAVVNVLKYLHNFYIEHKDDSKNESNS